MKTPLSPGALAKRPLVCRSFHIVAGVPDDRYIHCPWNVQFTYADTNVQTRRVDAHCRNISAQEDNTWPGDRRIALRERPMAFRSIQLKYYVSRKICMAFSFPAGEDEPVTNTTLTSWKPPFSKLSSNHVPKNIISIFLKKTHLQLTCPPSQLLCRTEHLKRKCILDVKYWVSWPNLNFSPGSSKQYKEAKCAISVPLKLIKICAVLNF